MIDDFQYLTSPKIRQELEVRENIFIAEGFKILERTLALGFKPRTLITNPKWLPRLEHLDLSGFNIHVMTEEAIEKLTGFHVHRGVLASFNRKPVAQLSDVLNESGLVVLLDNLVDLENVGTIFRNAAAFSAAGVLLGPTAPDPYFRRVIKASMGASLMVPFARVSDYKALDDSLAPRKLIGLSLQAQTQINDFQPAGDEILVFGSEGFGISEKLRSRIDVELLIPIQNSIDSLNVAAAASITLWQFSQRV